MTDCGFPIIQYNHRQTPRAWGQSHGEAFRAPIVELVEIRTQLMREKNPALNDERIARLAHQQWDATKDFDAELASELQGLAEGAAIDIVQLVVLNNYTDFRDIQVDDQGCSLAYVNAGQGPIVGQTWDMHGSAKNYVCCIEIPVPQSDYPTIVFSVVGCVGMMGFNGQGGMLGVNNINTDGARAGALWPAIVRAVLNRSDLQSMATCLKSSPKTSGHNYLIACGEQAQMWEVAPGLSECVSEKTNGEHGYLLHTNHCLGEKMVERETTISQNSTTHLRMDLLQQKIEGVQSWQHMVDLMNDHENYPKSICSNFQTDAQDPSITCGGAVGHLQTGHVTMWRGDAVYDANFVSHEFKVF